MVVVQKCEQLVIFLLRERVELVVVALRALDGQAKHTFPDGIHAVK